MSPVRRKLLLIILAVLVGGYFINMVVDRYYFQPAATYEREATGLEQRLRENRIRLKQVSKRISLRDELELRSLPSNIELATSMYQAWLVNLVTKLDLTNPTVDSTSPIVEDEATRLQFTIRGRASLRQFTNLLYEFYKSGSLQKIQSITLTPTSGSERLDFLIGIEALALNKSQNEESLTPRSSNRLVYPELTDYLTISKRNVFGEGAMSALIRSTRLTAITSDRLGVREAWFFVERDNITHFLHQGDSIILDSVTLVVKEIATDFVVLELDGQLGRLEVGKAIDQITYLDRTQL